MKRFIIAILFFTFSQISYATATNIRCPDINLMHQSADQIVDAGLLSGKYIASTDPFAIWASDMGWFAVVYNIDATSIKEALEKARLAMRSISRQDNEFAESYLGIYVCEYDHGKIKVVNSEEDWRKKLKHLAKA